MLYTADFSVLSLEFIEMNSQVTPDSHQCCCRIAENINTAAEVPILFSAITVQHQSINRSWSCVELTDSIALARLKQKHQK